MGIRSLISKNIGVKNIDTNKDGIADFRFFNGSTTFPEAGGYLLNYSTDITFTRTSEASYVDPRSPLSGGTGAYSWDFVDTVTPWKSNNQPRIFSDGAILIEGSRTNLLEYSSNFQGAGWVAGGTPVFTGSQPAPDGGSDAYIIEDDNAAGFESVANAVSVTLSQSYAVSCFFGKDNNESRQPSLSIVGATARRIYLNTKTGATGSASDALPKPTISDAGSWWHVAGIMQASSSIENYYLYPAIGTTIGITNAAATGSCSFWGAQFELGSFISSPIRTTGASEVRAAESAVVPAGQWPEQINSGKWEFDVWPTFSSTPGQLGSGIYANLIGKQNTHFISFYDSGAAMWIRIFRNSVQIGVWTTATWSPYQKMTIQIDWPSQTATLLGATTGNGSVALGQSDWGLSPESTSLDIGFQTGVGRQANCVISRPRAI